MEILFSRGMFFLSPQLTLGHHRNYDLTQVSTKRVTGKKLNQKVHGKRWSINL